MVEPITLIYILGMPYSGSSLVALALGSDPRTLNAGEVIYLENDYNGGAGACLCGSRLRDCPFWEAFTSAQECDGRRPGLVFSHRPALRLDPIDAERSFRLKLAGWLGATTLRLSELESVQGYRQRHLNFLRDIAEFAGVDTVVDASKLPIRLGLLQGMPEIDLKVLWVRRPVRSAYAARLKRAKRRNRFYSQWLSPYYIVWALLQHFRIRLAYRRIEPSARDTMSLDDFAQEPAKLERTMSRLLGRPFRLRRDGRKLITDGQHVFTGNRWMIRPGQATTSVHLSSPTADELTSFERGIYTLFARVVPALRG